MSITKIWKLVELLPPMVGHCDREINCGYHLTPKECFKDSNIDVDFHINRVVIPEIKTPTFHPIKLVNLSNKNYDKNNFIQYLKTIFTEKQVDRISEFHLNQCLFGLHLINQQPNLPIAIVESEKTACIMSEIFDNYIWLACGSLSNLNEKMLTPIKNKKVILYPDLSINQKAYKEWKTTSEKLNKKDFNISVSHLLEDHCLEQQREKGYDIVDYFLNTSVHNITYVNN